MSTQILRDRDTNAQIPAVSEQKEMEEATKGCTDENRTLQSKLQEDRDSAKQQSYVSPSDAIMSPATKKLSNFKQKQMTKQKPRSLFAKAMTAREKDFGPDGSVRNQSPL